MSQSSEALREWFGGRRSRSLRFSDLWKLFLARIAERVRNLVDEEGQLIAHLVDGPYSYDLAHVAEQDEIRAGSHDLLRIAAHLEQHGWCHLNRRGPIFISLTKEGFEKGIEILNDIRDLKDGEIFQNWILVTTYRFTEMGPPFSRSDGAVDLQRVIRGYLRGIPRSDLGVVVAELQEKDLIVLEPDMLNNMWVRVRPTGVDLAKSLIRNWNRQEAIPAADRFVQLDDNSPTFNEAVARLEELILEVKNARLNDWPEKEGVLQSLKSALEMIRTRYVNKRAVLGLLSAAVGYIALKFADAPIMELANKTWVAVKGLF